jgi:hypothetical protein
LMGSDDGFVDHFIMNFQFWSSDIIKQTKRGGRSCIWCCRPLLIYVKRKSGYWMKMASFYK